MDRDRRGQGGQLRGRAHPEVRAWRWLGVRGGGGVWDVVTGNNPLDDVIDDWREAWQFFEDAMAMIEILRELPGQIEEILGMVSDPMGALTDYTEGELQELLEPLRETVNAPEVDVELDDAPEELFEFGQDLAEVADTDTLTEAPTDAYDAGAQPRRAGT